MTDSPTPDAAQPLQLIPGAGSLGWGYDIFGGRYADPASTTAQLLNLGETRAVRVDADNVFDIPTGVAFQPVRTGEVRTCTGSSIEQHQANLAVHAGLSGEYGCFNGELDVGYDHATFSDSRYAYTTCIDSYHLWRLQVGQPKMNDYLQEGFNALVNAVAKAGSDRETIDQLNNEFFRTFGTHYLREVVVGARALYKCTTDTNQFTDTTKLAAAARASYGLFVKATANVDHSVSAKEFDAASNISVATVGGDEVFAHDLAGGKYGSWLASVDRYPVFVDFTRNSLQPIWTLSGVRDRQNPNWAGWAAAYDRYAAMASALPGLLPPMTGDEIVLQTAGDDGTAKRYLTAAANTGAPDGDPVVVRGGTQADTAAPFKIQVLQLLGNPPVGAVARVRLKAGSQFFKRDPSSLWLHRYNGTNGQLVSVGADVNEYDTATLTLYAVDRSGEVLKVAIYQEDFEKWWCPGKKTLESQPVISFVPGNADGSPPKEAHLNMFPA